MRKKLFVLCFLVCVIFAATAFSNARKTFEEVNYTIRIGEATVQLQDPVYVADGRTYVSARSMCGALGIPIYWNGENEEIHMDIYNKKVQVSDKTTFKEEGVIPDEETALAVGKIILERYCDGVVEYETDEKIYYLRATFREWSNAWVVSQSFKFKDEQRGWAAGGGLQLITVILSKNTGEVLYINTYSMLPN